IGLCRKHYLVGRGIKGSEKFFDQTRFDTACFTRSDEVTNNGFEPGIFAHAKKNTRPFAYFDFVDRCTGQQVPECIHTLDHFLAELFFSNFLHGVGYKLKIGAEGDIELNLVPNVGKKRPRIIINEFVEHFLIRKLDQPTARMIAGKIFAAELPKSGIEISYIDYVACGLADLYAITHPEGLTNQNVNPCDEAFHRGLDGKGEDHRANTECGKRSIPIDENDRYGHDYDYKRDDQVHYTLKCETGGRILDPAQPINGNNSRDGKDDHDQRCAA